MVNDAHFLLTGYGKYGRELLSRLSATKKYEIAELACFGKIEDVKSDCNWLYYANHVNGNHPLFQEYDETPDSKIGKWRFDKVCLDFKPDIVFAIRDPWVDRYITNSSLRDFYNLTLMPTVDSIPYKTSWIDMLSKVDNVFSYTDWGVDILRSYGVNAIGSAPCGCDSTIYKPSINKQAHKQQFNIYPHHKIIGMVGRNQIRKLFPSLFEAFKKYLSICVANNNQQLANDSYLYLHTSYPDFGGSGCWDIPELLKEHQLGRKVLFSYYCKHCKSTSCSFYKGKRAPCTNCGSLDAYLPSSDTGYTEQQLASVYQLFDLYIQYSSNEGLGIPAIEAASCGIPVMEVDYSAMSDVVRKVNGVPIKVKHMHRDIYSGAYKAIPDDDDCAAKMYEILSKPTQLRDIVGRKCRDGVLTHYNWHRVAEIWENHFDSVQLSGLQGKWDSAERKVSVVFPQIPKDITHEQFVRWLIITIMQEPQLLDSKIEHEYIDKLYYGLVDGGSGKIAPFTRKMLYNQMKKYAINKHNIEQVRCGKQKMQNEDFLDFAKERLMYI